MGPVQRSASRRERVGVRYGRASRRARGQRRQQPGRGGDESHDVGGMNRGATVKTWEVEADTLTRDGLNELKKFKLIPNQIKFIQNSIVPKCTFSRLKVLK
jgi:hypothetical protein